MDMLHRKDQKEQEKQALIFCSKIFDFKGKSALNNETVFSLTKAETTRPVKTRENKLESNIPSLTYPQCNIDRSCLLFKAALYKMKSNGCFRDVSPLPVDMYCEEYKKKTKLIKPTRQTNSNSPSYLKNSRSQSVHYPAVPIKPNVQGARVVSSPPIGKAVLKKKTNTQEANSQKTPPHSRANKHHRRKTCETDRTKKKMKPLTTEVFSGRSHPFLFQVKNTGEKQRKKSRLRRSASAEFTDH
eukprot:TRINITY_DN3846_c0_g1_i1.p1 TRINITY_DN3846_c0_g1~~TRINITY_DN3846_c0_g1_i1.p1  ORF type:complete len:243 (+),score=23.75 TRINITY_DN3846_c0_g1_i1:725-1453(+)